MRAEYVFWTCLALIAHTYVLYPVVLFVAYAAIQIRRDLEYLSGRSERRVSEPKELPAVSLLIPAYNEEAHLGEKLANLEQIDYPPDRLEVILVSDGSSDGTNRLLADAPQGRCRTIFLPVRQGKPTALNRAAEVATGDIFVLSDAATLLAPDAVRKLVRHFRDPRVGVVCGAVEFRRSVESAQTEGVYWKYECALRLMESRLGSTLTASGALYAIRRSCFVPLPPDTILDDFVLPMNARRRGYRVLYDPEAIGLEVAPESVAGEFVRRVRLAAGSFQALPQLLRASLGGFSFFAFLSHKVLRWLLPFLLIGLLLSNVFLLARIGYGLFFGAQVLLLLLAAAGRLWRPVLERIPFGLVSYFLSAINVAFLMGFVRSVFARKEVTWQRTSP